jgi:uncharacterized membrane protein YphA (DoxX/SURF4 family)
MRPIDVPVPGAVRRLTAPVAARVPAVVERALRVETAVHDFSVRNSVVLLRIALGFVFVVFGVLKFFPGLSPAQQIAEQTTRVLTLGLVPVSGLLVVVAFVEVLAGLLLIHGRHMRAVVWLLLFEMVAILSPLVTLPGELFDGPHHLPSLLGQYILKDVVLLAGVLVLAAHTKDGRIVVPALADDDPAPPPAPAATEDARPRGRRSRPSRRLVAGLAAAAVALVALTAAGQRFGPEGTPGPGPVVATTRLTLVGPDVLTRPLQRDLERTTGGRLTVATSTAFLPARLGLRSGSTSGVLVLRGVQTRRLYTALSDDAAVREVRAAVQRNAAGAGVHLERAVIPVG